MKSKLRLGIVGSAGVPGRYGGRETLAHQLVVHLSEQFEVSVYCSENRYEKSEQKPIWKGARLIYVPVKATGILGILYVMLSVLHGIRRNDVLLVLGIKGAFLLPFIKWFSNRKVVVNLDGMINNRSRTLVTRWLLKWAERIAVRYSDEVICGNRKLQQYIKETYHRKPAVIECGGDHVSKESFNDFQVGVFPFLGKRYAINVCRIEPENNISLILETFARYPRFPLVIIGNWNAKRYGRALRKRFQAYRHIFMIDPIYDPKVLNMLRSNAYLYIHGHSGGGTNPALVEAMSLGLPVFAYDGTFNRETTQNAANYFQNHVQLIALLESACSDKLQGVGPEMHKIAQKRYTWKQVGKQYKDIVRSGLEETYSPLSAAPALMSVSVPTGLKK